MSNPQVSIIIASYNGVHFLQKCIPSVQQSELHNIEIIVYDDNSTDTTEEYIAQQKTTDDRIVYFKNTHNLGAAKTRNNAVLHARSNLLIFLDNDTEVKQNWIDELLKCFEDPTIGAVQSTLIDYHERDKIQLIGVKLIPHAFWGAPLLRGQSVEHIPPDPQQIIALSAALAVRKEIFQKIGGFDELLAVYTEDIELSYRIWLSGFRIVNSPKSHVFHWTKKVSDRKTMHANTQHIYFHLAKNTIRSIIKNYSSQNIILYMPFSLIILSGRAIVKLFYNDPSAIIGTAKGLWWNIVKLPKTLQERKKIRAMVEVKSEHLINQKVFTSESLLQIYHNYFRS
ncbi:MAG: hypothetical protein KatS3mg087_0968 [Patescibacteria group bacterium]|nr:MAG: hypothetical protein KatS3mg087_0968 [Patescibacteria group bacterium]